MSEEPVTPETTRVPASPEAIALAQELVQRYPQCFWFRHPQARIRYTDDIGLVAERLRRTGDKVTWQEAAKLLRCR